MPFPHAHRTDARRARQRLGRRNSSRTHRFEPLEDRRLLAAFVFDEGGDANWNTAANWFDQTNGVNDVLPGAVDDVTIDNNVDGSTQIVMNADAAVNSLVSEQHFLVSGGTLTLQRHRSLHIQRHIGNHWRYNHRIG